MAHICNLNIGEAKTGTTLNFEVKSNQWDTGYIRNPCEKILSEKQLRKITDTNFWLLRTSIHSHTYICTHAVTHIHTGTPACNCIFTQHNNNNKYTKYNDILLAYHGHVWEKKQEYVTMTGYPEYLNECADTIQKFQNLTYLKARSLHN